MNQKLNVSIELSTVAAVAVANDAARTFPVVLDEAVLEQIAGGVTEGPNGTW